MFTVIKAFFDLQDGQYRYCVGDNYPRKGYKPSDERIAELSGSDNKQGCPLIKQVEKKSKKVKE